MTTDLRMLLASAALYWVLILTASNSRMFKNGMRWALGNRDVASDPVAPWAERAQRACDNMQENLILFAAVVLVAHAAHRAGASALV
jgi:uncharacterized MAPEG superfamily protein